MTDQSKLTLSDGEMELVTNTEWILTKRKIIDKVQFFFGGLAVAMQEIISGEQEYIPAEVIASAPKIAKGENYLQLPYVLLDYPRCFDKDNVFAIRTMFLQALEKNIAAMQNNNFYLCTNTSEWEHHFESGNYISANTLTAADIKAILSQQHFVKVAAKFSLHQWNEMDVVLQKSFSDAIRLLQY